MLRNFGKHFTVRIVPVLRDNYTYIIHDTETNVAGLVDVSQTKPVLDALASMGVSDFSVLSTHKHWDHTGGNADLFNKFGDAIKIYGGANDSVPHCSNPVREGDTFQLGSLRVSVIDVPCHTSGHVAYHVVHPSDPENGAVFTGDTMFVAGIGAFFEGTAEQMIAALDKLTALPDNTCVFPGHEYTVNFMKFSAKIDPSDAFVASKLKEFEALRSQSLPTVPSTIADEKKFNMFARVRDPALQKLTGIADPVKLMEHLYNACD